MDIKQLMTQHLKLAMISFIFFLLVSCDQPIEKKYFFDFQPHYAETADSILINMHNPLVCPLRVSFSYADQVAQTITLMRQSDGSIHFPKGELQLQQIIEEGRFELQLGKPYEARLDSNARYVFPFPRGNSYQVTQAYNGQHTHNNNSTRYAIDLNLQEGDTICAAREGSVVGVIDSYQEGGNRTYYQAYTNQVIIYHADGSMATYTHLQPNGALVAIGDRINALTPIALAGKTGYTTEAKLHFNVLIPTDGKAKSCPIKFVGIDGVAIKVGYDLSH